ncbi:ABC transporter permease [Planctomicrobium sp. SH664]|uniref:ABC transporter permease n=1 Tax=Planctomicrobium sp. SH664 TaxID=3448125 RepID=UPI003F5C55AB
MFTGTTALLLRAVRADAQQRQAHLLRLGAGLLLLWLLVGAHMHSLVQEQSTAVGLNFFRYLSYLWIALLTLAALGPYSSAITEEREEGTLELLLMAGISPVSILLGKSTSRIFSTVLLFVAQLPFAMLSLTLGGITVVQVLAVYLSLMAYLFLIANLALLISVCSSTGLRATSALAVVLFLLLGLYPLNLEAGWISVSPNDLALLPAPVGEVVRMLGWIHQRVNVGQQVESILEPLGEFRLLSEQVLYSFLGGGVLFGLAWWKFERLVRCPAAGEAATARKMLAGRRWLWLLTRPGRWPLIWKDFHFVAGGWGAVAMKCVVLALLFGLCLWRSDQIEQLTHLPAPRVLRFTLYLLLAAECVVIANLIMLAEKSQGTLSSLMMLPRSPLLMGYAKLTGCLLAMVPTFLAAVLASQLDPEFRFAALAKEEVLFSIGCLLIICQLTVLCCLFSSWGALPLALAIMLLTAAFLAPLAFLQRTLFLSILGHDPGPAPAVYLVGLTSVVLQWVLHEQLIRQGAK